MSIVFLMMMAQPIFGQKEVKANIIMPDSCLNGLIRNSNFIEVLKFDGSTTFWSKAYGNPVFNHVPGEGCFDDGYVEIKGNQTSGNAIFQVLDANNRIKKGKKYVLNVAVRFLKKLNQLDYGKIRVIAFNGTLPSNGVHSLPNANVSIIGRSGKIRDCGDWSVIEFPIWTANKDFQNIAINVFSDNQTTTTVWIDDMTLCETEKEMDCAEIQLDQNNNPIPPQGYGATPTGFICKPEAEEVNDYNGSLQDLYGSLYGYNGTTSWYAQAQDKCFSIGGTLPVQVLKYNCDDSLKAAGINMSCVEFQKQLDNPNFDDISTKPLIFSPLNPLQNNCKQGPLTDQYERAFGGRDIIFIHGLMLEHLCDRANNKAGADADWPANQHEFYNGYYKNVANSNWAGHIQHYIGKYHNRYLVVTYNCSQRAEVAVHSVLSQIREAMENGKGVVYDKTDNRRAECFGRDYIFISHSTGAIISDVALSIANKTKTDAGLKAKYGDIGLISDRCKGRVSIRGAFSGSSLATIMVAFQGNSGLMGFASLALSGGVCKKEFTLKAEKTMVLNSVLVDLVPAITRLKWSNYINSVPVPVLTIASGHPTAVVKALKYPIHPGFDDGVVTMDCASGRNNSLLMQPARYVAKSLIKAYDMGQPLVRGICYYLDQHLATSAFATASTPYLSPTGMVQPILTTSPVSYFKNHYPFIQSTSEHWLKGDFSTGYDYEPTVGGGANGQGSYPNNEEELVVENYNLFSSGIVSPAIISEMGEFEKGKFITYPAIKIKIRRGIPRPIVYWKRFYIWKRTYHKLKDETLYDCDYAYKYLFKN